MSAGPVAELCREVWEARLEGGRMPDDVVLARRAAVAVAQEVGCSASYDPETDRRVEWLRELARQRRLRWSRLDLKASADLEWVVERLIYGWAAEPCGKDRAAGGAGDFTNDDES